MIDEVLEEFLETFGLEELVPVADETLSDAVASLVYLSNSVEELDEALRRDVWLWIEQIGRHGNREAADLYLVFESVCKGQE